MRNTHTDNRYVYFIATEDGKYIRIGCSQNLHQRFAAIRRDAHKRFKSDVVHLGAFPGHAKTERWIQLKFMNFIHRGDWFVFDESIRKFIDAIGVLDVDVIDSRSLPTLIKETALAAQARWGKRTDEK